MQIKATRGYHYASTRKATIIKTDKKKVLARMWRKWNFYILPIEMKKMVKSYWKREFMGTLSYVIVIPLLDIYPRELKHVRLVCVIWVLRAALLVMTPNWKQHECLSTSE